MSSTLLVGLIVLSLGSDNDPTDLLGYCVLPGMYSFCSLARSFVNSFSQQNVHGAIYYLMCTICGSSSVGSYKFDPHSTIATSTNLHLARSTRTLSVRSRDVLLSAGYWRST